MSEDPKLFDAGDYNLFRYCHNDPIDLTDATGTETNMAGFSPLNNHNASVVDITIAERISLAQNQWKPVLVESGRGTRSGNRKTLEMPRMEKRSPAGPYPHPKNYQEYLAEVRAIEGGNPAPRKAAAFNPIDVLSGAIGAKAVATGAAKAVATGEETQLFPVFGNEAKGLGQYYTTVNPANIANYRQAAGLYPGELPVSSCCREH